MSRGLRQLSSGARCISQSNSTQWWRGTLDHLRAPGSEFSLEHTAELHNRRADASHQQLKNHEAHQRLRALFLVNPPHVDPQADVSSSMAPISAGFQESLRPVFLGSLGAAQSPLAALSTCGDTRTWCGPHAVAVRSFSCSRVTSSSQQQPSRDASQSSEGPLALVKAPQRAVSQAVAATRVRIDTLGKQAMELQAVRAAAKAWERFQKLPPVSRSIADARSAITRRQEALGMQLQAFWRTHSSLMIGVGGLGSLLLVDNCLVWLSSLFIAHPVPLYTHFNCLALSSAAVVGTGIFLRSRTSVNVDSVCSMALARLNSHPGTLEVLGAPVAQGVGVHGSTSSVSAAALLGGGVRFRFGLKESPILLRVLFPPKVCVCVFAAKGSEASGIVNVAVTKQHGQYTMELLAVDVQIPSRESSSAGPQSHDQQRVEIIGSSSDREPYKNLLKSLQSSLKAARDGETSLIK